MTSQPYRKKKRKSMNSLNAKNLFALSTLALLAACGGGDGGGTSTVATTPTTPAPTTVASSNTSTTTTSTAATNTLVTSVPKTTYVGEELAAFELLNKEREHCGFGLLAQNAKLDAAARGHADWLLINNYTGHFQVAGTPGFTGVDSTARIIASGYGDGKDFKGSEVVHGSPILKDGQGEDGVRTFATAPYHAIPLMTGNYREVGVSVRDVNDVGLSKSNRSASTIELEYLASAGPQLFESKKVRTYPCEGTTGVKSSLNGESPNPVPGRNLATNPTGSTILVIGDLGKTLTITSATMTNTVSGADVKLLPVVTVDNDPNKRLASNEGFFLPDAPLSATTAYRVNITGTNDGMAFRTSFTFTTGSGR